MVSVKKDFIKLLKKATQESHFHLCNLNFNQIDRVAMGSPLAPTFANFFMYGFEKRQMEEFKRLGVRTSYRYINDTFVLIKKDGNVNDLLSFMNSRPKNIKFTIENERNRKLVFLDVLVHRKIMNFSTSVYNRATFAGVYLN